MIEEIRAAARHEGGFVPFHAAGAPVRGSFRCAECGYGVAVAGLLPACPMCAGTSWEPELRSSPARMDERAESEG